MNRFFTIAIEKEILNRAIKVALVVGTILALINHFENIVTGNLSSLQILKILLTYTVPFGVSEYSQIMQRLEQEKNQ